MMQVIFHKTVPALICGGSTEDARKIFFFFMKITQFRKKRDDRQKKLKGNELKRVQWSKIVIQKSNFNS